MTKLDFMTQLAQELKKRGVSDSDDILEEYEQHFAFKLADGYSEEEIAYYDFSYILTQDFEESEDEKHFIVMGYKHPKFETIGWTKS